MLLDIITGAFLILYPNTYKIIRIYCIIDDILKGIGHQEDSRRRVSELVLSVFWQLGHQLKSITGASAYVIDSFPVAVCVTTSGSAGVRY